jgi:hypothetical protein
MRDVTAEYRASPIKMSLLPKAENRQALNPIQQRVFSFNVTLSERMSAMAAKGLL